MTTPAATSGIVKATLTVRAGDVVARQGERLI
jgi:hypothetical protein